MTGSDFLHLDPAAAPPRERTTWLAAQLRTAIADGALGAGARVPASRELAAELAFSRGVVVEAYRRLAEEGLLLAEGAAGTRVAETVPPATPPSPATDAPARPETLHLSVGAPDLSAFPRAAWLRAERRVLSAATSRELGYADPQGVGALRIALSGWLARSRGVVVPPERIVVTAGVTGALSLTAQVMRDRGLTACAIEDPSADGNRRILDYWLDSLLPVPVDADGIDVEALTATGARAVLTTPAHQFPTGALLSPARRRELVAWAEQSDGLIIEDDYDSEYRYDRAPVRALHASAPDRILHVSSLSKVLAPALRIGWMVAPEHWHDDLVRKRWATDLGSPALPQLALAELIRTGALERQVRRLRLRHRERRNAAVAAVRAHLPDARIEGIAAGLHLLVLLPRHVDDTALAERAAAAGIRVAPLSAYRFSPGDPGVVIGYGPHSPARLEAAIAALGRLI
ncbi:PLP-dependent aminotransferase family protein [Microbacterium sp.]|mgnify:FL=1|uniref:MocR-like pyridoxine biosynthesis transcription factor PdxR n=1 Tax=Microbacterium sp. TaxID=51671 RepID=UPI001AC17E62|nr:PLP-dependent aminotransferase family protein [Microbacterium sp.]MBN9155938.1 PLP-dependent aminotransferase family protein [Microbacterium sp.]MBS1899546.1 PLP-dependent aminotransferase family protein [Actinomycetota bacterium]